MTLGLRHIRFRKLAADSLEPFPSHDNAKRFFDYLMYGVGLVQPIALLPQILAIYIDHQKQGVSLATWGLLTFFNLLWMVYGIVHKDKPIAIANALLTVLDIMIVLGVLFF